MSRNGSTYRWRAFIAIGWLVLGLGGLALLVYAEGPWRGVGGVAVLTASAAETVFWVRVVSKRQELA